MRNAGYQMLRWKLQSLKARVLCGSGSPNVVPAPVAWASLRNLLETQILRHHPRFTE